MSDCRFGVSPVNYPDPDPETEIIVTCTPAGTNRISKDPPNTFMSCSIPFR